MKNHNVKAVYDAPSKTVTVSRDHAAKGDWLSISLAAPGIPSDHHCGEDGSFAGTKAVRAVNPKRCKRRG